MYRYSRHLCLVGAIFLCFLRSVVAEPARIELSAEERQFLKSHPIIRFGTNETWLTYVQKYAKGVLTGADVDILEYVNAATGANILLEAGQWHTIVEKAKRREIDGLATSTPLDERKAFFEFTDPYVREYAVLLVPAQNLEIINSMDDFSGRTVAIQKGNEFFASVIEPFSKIDVLDADSEVESVKMMIGQTADGSFVSTSTYYPIAKTFANYIRIGYVYTERPLEIVYSIRKDWPELVSIINKSLAAMPIEIQKGIYEKWFGIDTTGHSGRSVNVLNTIIVDDYFPYTFVNDQGAPDGFSVDLMKAATKVMGLDLNISVGTWQNAVEALEDGSIDFLPMMAYSVARDQLFDFSAPHTIAYDAIFTRKDTSEIAALGDLTTQKIIVMKNDQTHQYLSAAGIISDDQLILTDSLPDSLRLLASGEGDAAIMPKLVGLIYVDELNLSNLRPSPVVIDAYERQFSVAVSDGNQEILERISQGLSILQETHQYRAIYTRWFGAYEDTVSPLQNALRYLLWPVLFIACAGGILLVWMISLRKQVAARTNHLTLEISNREKAQKALRESEEKLRQSQKLESIGRLAGGVAHDFNNLLTTIIGYSELIAMEQDLNDTMTESIREIRKSADRAAALTQQLLAFSRKQVRTPQLLNLNKLIENSLNMLSRLIPANITIETALSPEIGLISVDPGQIDQILMNIAINASDALIDGGTITIETQEVRLDVNDHQKYPHVTPGKYVEMMMSDTGHGIDEKNLIHIFEPFFTTKEVGKGTGLGLATVYGIVKQSDGFIWADSVIDHGTTFTVHFPVVDHAEEHQVQSPERRRHLGGDETIFLVEDDEPLRTMAKRTLEGLGYTVIVAANGNDAVPVFERMGNSNIDCLVTDVIMPEMGGKALSEELLKKYPLLKTLFISGYTEDLISRDGMLDEGIDFLQKPFTPKKLEEKIRELLDRD